MCACFLNSRTSEEMSLQCICAADCRVLENNFAVFPAYGSRSSAEVSLIVGRSLVNVVFAGDGGRLVVTDVAVKSFEFRLVVVYAPNTAGFLFSSFGAVPERFEAASQWVIGMLSLIPR